MEAFQRLDRANILNIINTQVFQNICRIMCILTGRWIGRNNPVIGELMGATLGSITGKIFSEFLPSSEYSMIDDTDFELYSEDFKTDCFCEIWIPVEKKPSA